MKHQTTASIICLIFLLTFFTTNFFVGYYSNTYLKGDWKTHYEGTSDNYAPFWGWLSQPFAYKEQTYYLFGIIILCLIIPMALFWLTKDWATTFFYFSVGFVWRMDLFGAMPQAIAGLFLIFFVLINNWLIRIFLLIISLFVHNYLFILLLFCWLILELFKVKKAWLSLFCIPPTTSIDSGRPIKLTLSPDPTNYGFIMRFFGQDFFLPYVFLAFKGFIVKKRFDLIVIIIVLFICSFLFYGRLLYTLTLLGLIGLVWGFRELSVKWQRFFLVVGLILICVNLLHWLFESVGWCLNV